MITDAPPRAQARLREYARSDALLSLSLPEGPPVQALTRALAESMTAGEIAPVRRAGEALVSALAEFYEVPVPPLRVLGVRPHKVTAGVCTYQLFGDYLPSTQRIRVWMRTAIRERVSSPKALLNTLLSWAREKELKEIFLGTTDKFHAAHRFYEKNHFQRVPVDALPANFSRMAVDSIFYRHVFH